MSKNKVTIENPFWNIEKTMMSVLSYRGFRNYQNEFLDDIRVRDFPVTVDQFNSMHDSYFAKE